MGHILAMIVSCFEAPVSHDKPLVRLQRLIGGVGGQVRVLGPTVRRGRSAPGWDSGGNSKPSMRFLLPRHGILV
ncbi:hypothetical protein PspLS_03543 [Pyricularia sp. CBS 133598]|nr:hypothetical protein PspLS_03543 [Pyricularia sp. CBS 133598]